VGTNRKSNVRGVLTCQGKIYGEKKEKATSTNQESTCWPVKSINVSGVLVQPGKKGRENYKM
jgi:hypothetical protein